MLSKDLNGKTCDISLNPQDSPTFMESGGVTFDHGESLLVKKAANKRKDLETRVMPKFKQIDQPVAATGKAKGELFRLRSEMLRTSVALVYNKAFWHASFSSTGI